MPVPPPCLDDAAFSASSWVRIRCTLRCSAPLSDALSEAPSGDVTEGEVPGSAQAAMPRSTRSVPDARRWAVFPNDIGSSLHKNEDDRSGGGQAGLRALSSNVDTLHLFAWER